MCLRWCFRRREKPHSSKPPALLSGARAEDLSKAEKGAQTTAIQPTSHLPTVIIPEAKQEPQIPAIPEGLPSQVEDTLGACPRFRIVLVGKSGVGKSSLIANIFNIDKGKIDIAHHRAGNANIEYEYTSPENPRFILHDSVGFEPGSDGSWEKVQRFVERRQEYNLPEKIHAIWFCVVTPRTGTRLLQSGDEKLLQLANKLHIPIIAVFTKYDLLVNQFYQEDPATAEENASASCESSVKDLQKELVRLSIHLPITCVKVSTEDTTAKDTETLIDLTKSTRDRLQDVERKLEVLWVAAQQVNARLKVEVSISEGFKSKFIPHYAPECRAHASDAEYWLDLGQSSAFEGQILIDCMHRLHEDVLKVWNFNDPTGILSGINFFAEIIGLVKPLIESTLDGTSVHQTAVSDFGSGGAKDLVSLLKRFGHDFFAINYLYGTYQQYPSTAKLLATYVVNLVLVLHGIFTDTLPADPPRELSSSVVSKVVEYRRTILKKEPLDGIDLFAEFSTHPENVIKTEILKRLPPDSAAGPGR